MNNYVITYNSNNTSLFSEYEVIEGKTPKEALKNAYNKEYGRVTGDAGRYADIILIKGTFRDNTIYYEGKGSRLCFKLI